MISIVFVISCLFALTLCQNPSLPSWPKQFTTSISQEVSHEETREGTWAFDAVLGADRYDWKLGNGTFTEINAYDQKTRYLIEVDSRGHKYCHSMTIHGEMPVPTFEGYAFKGQTKVKGEDVDRWERETSSAIFRYFDDVKTTDPVLYEIRSHEVSDVRAFSNFKRGAPNPSVFNVNASFPGLCDDPLPWKPKQSNSRHPSLSAESCAEMKALVKKHFPAEYRTDMICIAHYESSWRCDVYNGICCYGLFQVNRNHLGEENCPSSVSELDKCDPNAKCAHHILDTQGLKAWTTWTDGDCSHWTGCSV